MLKCIAIDDEPLALRQIESYIRKIPYLELTASCNNALEAQPVSYTHLDVYKRQHLSIEGRYYEFYGVCRRVFFYVERVVPGAVDQFQTLAAPHGTS